MLLALCICCRYEIQPLTITFTFQAQDTARLPQVVADSLFTGSLLSHWAARVTHWNYIGRSILLNPVVSSHHTVDDPKPSPWFTRPYGLLSDFLTCRPPHPHSIENCREDMIGQFTGEIQVVQGCIDRCPYHEALRKKQCNVIFYPLLWWSGVADAWWTSSDLHWWCPFWGQFCKKLQRALTFL